MVTANPARPRTRAQLTEALDERDAVLTLLLERIPELEAQIQEDGWHRIDGDGAQEFSRDSLKRIIALSRLMYLKNPLINRPVNLQALYVWGQGMTITAPDEDVNGVVQGFMDDRRNKVELTSHQARTLKEIELQVTGNLFFTFFIARASGRVRVRSIPVEEIDDIITNPGDHQEPWYYRRVWTEQDLSPAGNLVTKTKTAYYPDWRYTPSAKPTSIGGKPVIWDTPVYHVKVGGFSSMRFGVPETYQALDWARAYKSFLEDWATIQKALARFAWNMGVKGGARGVAAAKTKLNTTEGNGAGAYSRETNPPPNVASTFIGADGTSMTPVKTAGAQTGPEEARQLKLMVAAATGTPETFFGDASVGNHATSKTLDRPTELKFQDRRTLWRDIHDDILQFQVDRAALASAGNLSGHIDTDDDGDQVVVLDGDVDRHIDITMPPILEHSVTEQVAAIVQAATLDGHPSVGTMDARTLDRLLLTALGLEDVDTLLEVLAPEGGESLMDTLAQQRADQAAAVADRQAQAQPPAPGTVATQERFTEALREVRAAARKVVAS